jgi:hypothetical protein
MESFRGGFGGEGISEHTGGSGTAYQSVDPAPLGFTGTSGSCADRSGLYCLLIDIFKFLLVATTLTIVAVFAFGLARGGSVIRGLNNVRRIFSN